MTRPAGVALPIRAIVRVLCFAAVLSAGLAAAPAIASPDRPLASASEAASLAIDRSAQGYVFPREGVVAQPAVTTRKKYTPVSTFQGGAAGLPVTPQILAGPHADSSHVAFLAVPAPHFFASHRWHSRAPPVPR